MFLYHQTFPVEKQIFNEVLRPTFLEIQTNFTKHTREYFNVFNNGTAKVIETINL